MTDFSVTGNTNYAPLVVDLGQAEILPLEGRDRVLGLKAFGMNAIVGKGWLESLLEDPNSRIIMIPAGARVSEDFARENNLYRHEHLNADPTQKGYLEDNRRVKAIRMGGHPSDALVVDPAAFRWIGTSAYEVPFAPHGTAFDTFMGTTFSEKYVKPSTGTGTSMRVRQGAAKVRVSSESFPEHFDTKNLFRDDPFQPEDHVFITQKLHGTSVRFGKVPVLRDLTWLERLAKRLGVNVRTHDYRFVAGSRRVTKSVDGQVEGEKAHWYPAGDIWTAATEPMADRLPDGFVVYAEIIGWTPDGEPIQPGYTYDLPLGQSAVYIYRVAVLAESGDLVDLPWRAVQKFAAARGWSTVPELDAERYAKVDMSQYLDAPFALTIDGDGDPWWPAAIPLSDAGTVDEGVVVRSDKGLQPEVRKAKSPIFLGHESKVMDEGLTDTEEEQA